MSHYNNNIEHMQSVQEHSPVNPTIIPIVNPIVEKKLKKRSNMWLYVFLLILIIALVIYFLIDTKIIKMPSLVDSTTSPSLSNTLGETFMSINK